MLPRSVSVYIKSKTFLPSPPFLQIKSYPIRLPELNCVHTPYGVLTGRAATLLAALHEKHMELKSNKNCISWKRHDTPFQTPPVGMAICYPSVGCCPHSIAAAPGAHTPRCPQPRMSPNPGTTSLHIGCDARQHHHQSARRTAVKDTTTTTTTTTCRVTAQVAGKVSASCFTPAL
jgi:hypothetical protein